MSTETAKLGIVMDNIATICPRKDTSFALLLEAQRRDYAIFYMQAQDLFLQGNLAYAQTHKLHVIDRAENYYQLSHPSTIPLHHLDLILMRKDPPVNERYWHAVYVLDIAEKQGVTVANKPQALRDIHEKLTSLWFTDASPPSIVTSRFEPLKAFVRTQHHVVLKPLHHMGGHGIMQVKQGDPNLKPMWELLTHKGLVPIMAQRFIPEIVQGDKRVLIVHGQLISHALVRMPPLGEIRANLAAGGTSQVAPLTEHDRTISQRVIKQLSGRGLSLIGLDIIGHYLTEINVTSPTGIRELERSEDLSICKLFFDYFQ